MKGLLLWICLGLASFAAAQNPPCAGGLGGNLFATGDDIQIEIVQGNNPSSATSSLILAVPEHTIYCGQSYDYGAITTVSNLVAGDELNFQIVSYEAFETFLIGPAARNPDGIAHAKVFCETNGATLIGFEASYGGGDLDYQDVVFRVSSIPAGPSIVTQPTSQTVDLGTSATLSVVVSGSGPLFYQWFKDGAVITGATKSLLSLPGFQEAGQGSYFVSVSNALGQVSSSPAQLTINRRPVADATAVRRLVVSANGINAVVTLDGARSGDADDDALRYAWFEAGKTNAFAATKVALIAKAVGQHGFSLVVSDERLSSTNAVVVTVATIPEALQDLVTKVANQRVVRPELLRGKLHSAINLYKRGNVGAVRSELLAFQTRVRSLVQSRNAVLAAELIQLAQDILDVLNVPATQLMASASSSFQVDLAWTDISANEDGFKIERSADGVHFTQIAQVLPNTTTFRDAGVFPDTTRSYRVRSFRGAANGSYSNVRTVVTPGSACAMSVVNWNGSPWSGYVLEPPEGLSHVVSVAGGFSHALALKSDGTVVAWGNDYFGAITPPAGLSNVVAVAAGWSHSLALKSDGRVVTWGDEYGQGTMPANLSGVVAIAVAEYHSLALKNDGTVVAWGNDDVGQSPVPAGLKGVVAIATSETHSLALKSDGTVVAWGEDYFGQSTVPVGLRGVVAVAASTSLSMALKNDGTVVRWGAWAFDELPTNAIHATAIAAGYGTGYALLPNGTLKQWGYWLPQPEGLENVQAVFASGNTAYALTTMPSRPVIKAARLASRNRIQLTWSGSETATAGYLITRIADLNGVQSAMQIGPMPPGTTNFMDAEVTAGGSYTYYLRAKNDCGESFYSDPWAVSMTPPESPLNTAARIGFSNRVDVSWYHSSRRTDGFVVERAPEVGGVPGAWAEIGTINATTTSGYYSLADTNVTGYSTNWYRVRAFNPLGNSPYGPQTRIAIVPPATAPYVNAAAFHDAAIINWYIYNSDATGFQIERAPDLSGSPGAWSVIATGSGDRYVDTGMGLGSYWYRVRVFNWVGVSPASVPVIVTIAVPNAPQLRGTVGTTNHVDLTIEAFYPHDQDGFQVERAADAGETPGAWTIIGTLAATNQYTAYFTDTNVTANTTNWYRARAFNALGYSDYGVEARVDVVPPPAPYINSAASARDYVTLGWNPNYEGNVAGSQIDRAPDIDGSPGTWRQIASITNGPDGNETFFSESGLSLGTYWYRVRSYNWVGVSSSSDPVSINIVLPEAPSLSASVGTTNRVEVSIYSADPHDQDGFKLERAADVDGAPGTWSQIASLPATNAYTVSFADTHVTARSTNWYRARAFNVLGQSDYSEPAMVEVVAPSAPYDLFVDGIRNRAYLQWYESYNGRVDGYEIERAADDSGSPGIWSRVGIATNGPSFEDKGLSLGTHWYRVRAYNWLGHSDWSEPASAETAVTGRPTIYDASIGGTNRAVIQIRANYPPDQDAFQMERAPDVAGSPGGWSEIGTVQAWDSSYATFTDTNVMAYSTNWYRARGSNVLGFSAYSDPVSLEVVPPPPPAYLSGSPYRNGVNLRWARDYSGGVDVYEVERAADVSGNPGSWVLIATNVWNDFFADTGLSRGTYWYRVRAHNWVGVSSNSAVISVGVVPPGAPSVVASLGTTNRINVSIYSADPIDQDDFRVERATDLQGSPGTWLEIGTIPATNQYYASFTDTNVTANSTNWYRARALNGLGASAYSAASKVEVVPPSAPYNLSAGHFRDYVNLYWNETYAGPISGYVVERAPDVLPSPGPWIAIGTSGGPFFNDAGLSAGTYWYRVTASNWVGVSQASLPAIATIGGPAKPSLYASVGGTNRVEVSINAAAPYDQDQFKLEYAADVQGSPGGWIEIASIAATNKYSMTFTHSNVLANTTNWYRARSFNALGVSGYSAPTRCDIVPPPAPIYVTASRFRDAVDLHWYVEYPGKLGGYQIDRASDVSGSPGQWSSLATTTDGEVSSYHDSGLALGTYWYRVRAYNWVGMSSNSGPVSASIVILGTPFVSLALGNTNQVALQVIADYPPDQDGFQVERATDVQGVPGAWTEIGSYSALGAIYTSFTDTNVPAYTTNWYRVRGYGPLGHSDYSTPHRIAIVPPGAPGTITTYHSSIQNLLDWQASDGIVQGYGVERATNSAGSPGTWEQITQTTYAYYYDYPPAPESGGYWYRVRAFNWVGWSEYSSVAGVNIPPNRAGVGDSLKITSIALSDGSVQIEWQATGGTTNFVEAAETLDGPYSIISSGIAIPGDGVVRTNYEDSGAVLNASQRFYRIRVSK